MPKQLYRVEMDEESKQRLRDLRLWHWLAVVSNRALEEATEAKRKSGELPNQNWIKETIAAYRNNANFHLSCVQTLNDFFDVGDTAQRDNARRAELDNARKA